MAIPETDTSAAETGIIGQLTAPAGRAYVLEIARLLLGCIGQDRMSSSPLTSASWFHEICNSTGENIGGFYANFSHHAKDFLRDFDVTKLAFIICAGIPPRKGHDFPVEGPIRTPMRLTWPNGDMMVNCDGRTALRNLAAVVLTAAAYDLCYSAHHQDGLDPL